jgi:hypothetical protein
MPQTRPSAPPPVPKMDARCSAMAQSPASRDYQIGPPLRRVSPRRCALPTSQTSAVCALGSGAEAAATRASRCDADGLPRVSHLQPINALNQRAAVSIVAALRHHHLVDNHSSSTSNSTPFCRSLPLNWCRYVASACSRGLTSQHFSAGPASRSRGSVAVFSALLPFYASPLSCFSAVEHRAGARVRGAALPHRLSAARTLACHSRVFSLSRKHPSAPLATGPAEAHG